MMYLLSSTLLFFLVSELKEAGREICAVMGLMEAIGGIIFTDIFIFLRPTVAAVGSVSAGADADDAILVLVCV